MLPCLHSALSTSTKQASIIDTGDRLTLDASLDALRHQPDLLDRVVASLFDAPERRTIEVIIDRPSSQMTDDNQ